VARLLMQADSAQRSFVGRRLAELDLHVGQELFLMQLWEKDGLSQSELMARLGCTAPTVTKTSQRLERVGLVRREREGRRRVSRVYLTQAGWDLRESVEEIWRVTERQIRAGLSDEEAESFAASLAKVTESFNKASPRSVAQSALARSSA